MSVRDLVVISTAPGREEWVKEILSSISRPCIVVSDYGFELGKLKWVLDNTNAERFLFLQDSLVIRDENFIDLIFEQSGSACLLCTPKCLGAYLGLYERKVLERVGIPTCSTKEDAIRYEIEWTSFYINNCPEFRHTLPLAQREIRTLRKFGRENLVLVNDYYEKWYGNWGEPVQDLDSLSTSGGMRLLNLQMLEKSRRVSDLIKENQRIKKSWLNKCLDAIRYFIKYFQGY
jgi:hypothetical protein